MTTKWPSTLGEVTIKRKNECLIPGTPVWHTATGTDKVGAAYWGKFVLTSLKPTSVSLQNRLNKVLGEIESKENNYYIGFFAVIMSIVLRII